MDWINKPNDFAQLTSRSVCGYVTCSGKNQAFCVLIGCHATKYREPFDNGFSIYPNINPKFYSCGGISTKSLVIEPNGNIQKCYEFAGDNTKCIGNILDQSSERYKNSTLKNITDWYSWSPFDKKECVNCKVLPLCLSACSIYGLSENENVDISYKRSSLKYNLELTLKTFLKYKGEK